MLNRYVNIKLLALFWVLFFLISICWGQEPVVPNQDLRIKLSTFTFDPLKELPTLPEQLRIEPPKKESAYYIIQFKHSLMRTEQEILHREYGLKLAFYIPNYAYLEKVTLETLVRLKKMDIFRSSVLYQPAFKISPDIGKVEFRTPERKSKATEGLFLRAILFPDADESYVIASLKEVDASEIKIIDDRKIKGPVRVIFILQSKDDIPKIAHIEAVRWIEEVAEIIEDNVNTAGTIQSGTPGIEPIWNQALHGEGQIIGIIDSGPLDINHCFFRDPINNTPRPAHRKVLDIRNASGSNAGGHATFVAGCAAGDDFNNPGGHNRRGGAWCSRLISGNNRDIGLGLTTMFAELNSAAVIGATIHSNSWHDNTAGAGNPATYNQTAADVDNFIWNNEDHLVMGSAGNNGEEQGPPGTAKNAICVGASQSDPNEMNFADGNYGPTADGRRKPDLMVPGCNIQSATVNTTCTTGPRSTCATSYATPHIAAAAALARQYYTEGWYPSGTRQASDAFTPTGALIKATLLNSTIDMTGIGGYPGDLEGWGLCRLDNVLCFSGDVRKLMAWDVRNSIGLFTGDSHNYAVFIVNSSVPLKATLVWSEPPALAGSTDPVVNNLDLSVISPDGITYWGNVFSGGQSTTGGMADALNNVEIVQINTPQVGRYTIKVNGAAVNSGNPGQGYALVVAAATGKFNRFDYSYHVGSAHPLGHLESLADANINVQVDFRYRLNERLRLKLMAGLNQFTAEHFAGIDHPRWINANLNIQAIFPTSSGLSYYLQAGPGGYWPKSGSAEIGFNVGGGSQIPIGGPFNLEFGLDFHQIQTKDPTRFLTLQLGVLYR